MPIIFLWFGAHHGIDWIETKAKGAYIHLNFVNSIQAWWLCVEAVKKKYSGHFIMFIYWNMFQALIPEYKMVGYTIYCWLGKFITAKIALLDFGGMCSFENNCTAFRWIIIDEAGICLLIVFYLEWYALEANNLLLNICNIFKEAYIVFIYTQNQVIGFGFFWETSGKDNIRKIINNKDSWIVY